MFVSKFFGGVVPAPCDKGADKVQELGAAVSEKVQEYVAAMEKVRQHPHTTRVSAINHHAATQLCPWFIL